MKLKRATRMCICFAFINIFSVAGFAQQESIEEKPKLTISLRGAQLDKALEVLSAKTGLNFMPANAGIAHHKININLDNVTVDDAVTLFMETNKLGYRQQEGTNVYLVDEIATIMKVTSIKSIRLEYAEATKLVELLTKITTPGVGSAFADERTNTLIVRDSPEVIRDIEALLEKLDQPTPQVYIQAAIVEISLNNNLETGVEWFWKDPKSGNVTGTVKTDFGLQSGSGEDQNANENSISEGLSLGNGLGVGLMNAHVDVVLHALKTNYEMNLLSRPRLITLDNEEATIEVGDQIPYKVLNEFGITSYEFKNATIKLLVKPHINNDQTITVYLEPNADYQNGITPDGTPIIAMRKAKTSVVVKNGSTIVIGGLIRNAETSTRNKVPILGSIPLLGYLFRSDIKSNEKTELAIFLTPIILDDSKIGSYEKLMEDFDIKKRAEKKFK
ncbi:MAG: type II secretion system protein GspD [Candidatus Zhuqueibacterota bacterium]